MKIYNEIVQLEIESKITVDGVIALADAEAVSKERFAPSPEALERQRLADENISHETPLSEVFEDQVYCSDLVLLTKTDIVTKDDLSKAKIIAEPLEKGYGLTLGNSLSCLLYTSPSPRDRG